jgi:hypothetical protein
LQYEDETLIAHTNESKFFMTIEKANPLRRGMSGKSLVLEVFFIVLDYNKDKFYIKI